MRIERFGPGATAEEVRALTSGPPNVVNEVQAILGGVRSDGDASLLRLTRQLDGAELTPARLRVEPEALTAAAGALAPDVRAGLETAIANVGAVAEAQVREGVDVELPEGQRIDIAELPVASAGAYVPAGRAAYPSSLVMIAATARAAGVERIVVCAAPRPEGELDPLILGAAALCEVDEVYRVGGAQAIAALAYGTQTIQPVDVIAGPGNPWVQEAKRQVFGTVGIDGIAGPSELVIVAEAGDWAEPLALDLLAQAEHGQDSLVALISTELELLNAIAGLVASLADANPSVADAPLALVQVRNLDEALALADAIAAEHLQLVGAEAERRSGDVRTAGCVFVGPVAATAFGDYVAGSNHVLPTGGAARFQSAVSPATFRRRMARVSLSADAAARLAAKGAPVARAEGFPVHAESMERRA
jgi:histidinol dehydrogenase